ncbi:hypothetical protein DPMN_081074 [Dreissena polymorpha]|uniref:DNA 3'-5' helicase n=1 Tax=Dreissena polymorpha TaxID=45954 RepID=A0A9D3Y5D8_DREPO|nr:hypothetical protein DPMN_081074 [Dreissena polymorpha]
MASRDMIAREFECLKGEFKFTFNNLKEKQINVIASIVKKVDCKAIFPTGFGKSACYILPPLIMTNMRKRHFYAIVVSPLRSLINDQVRQLANIGINAVIYGPDTTAEKKKSGSNS